MAKLEDISVNKERLIPLIDAIIREDLVDLTNLAAALPPNELNSALLRCFMFSEDSSILSILLNAGANIDHQDQEGRTAIFLAVKYERTDIVQLLISRNCNVNLGKYNQSNCLHLAARRGNTDIVKLLTDSRHHLNATNWGGNTAILIACRFGQTKVVECLLSANCDVSIPNKLGHYPLHYAAFTGDTELIKLLTEHNADADVRTHLGITPIMLACERKRCEVVKMLSDRCDLTHQERLYGGNVLHWAVASGCCPCVRHLISDCGMSVESTDLSGRTPLLQAVQSKHPDVIVVILADSNVDLSSTSVNSMALHLAAWSGHHSCVEVLCTHERTKHLINRRDYFGDTPLDLATRAVHSDSWKPALEILDAIDILLRHGAEHSLSSSGTREPVSPLRCMVGIDQLGSIVSPLAEVTSNFQYCKSDNSLAAVKRDGFKVTDANSNADLLQNDRYKQCEQLAKQLWATGLSSDEPTTVAALNSFSPIFKTYSPVKMALISMLKCASCEQMVAPVRFDFGTWLDSGPEAFVLKVTSLDMTDWLYRQTHTAWPLRELCRGTIRRNLGYRAHEKVHLLPLPKTVRDFLNMTELEEINTKEIRIRSTGSYDDIDME